MRPYQMNKDKENGMINFVKGIELFLIALPSKNSEVRRRVELRMKYRFFNSIR